MIEQHQIQALQQLVPNAQNNFLWNQQPASMASINAEPTQINTSGGT